MEYVIDNLDRGIIKLLSIDGRMSFSKLAAKLEVTEKTIRLRYKNLVDKEILEVVGIVNPIALGLKSGAIIQVKALPANIPNVVNQLKANKMIRYVTLTSGDYPILIQIAVKGLEEITSVLYEIYQIDGVTEANTIVQMEVFKNSFEYI